MNFSGIPNVTVLGKFLRFPLRFIPGDMVLPVLQGRLRGYKWIAGSSNHGCWLGTYECRKQTLISKIVVPGKTVFDLGAHAGSYTLLFSELVGPTGRVVAFEPVPRNVQFVKLHLKLIGIFNATVL